MSEFDPSEWGPPLAVIGVGLALGAGALAYLRPDKKASDAIGARGHDEDLKRREDEAREALAVLEMQKDDMDPADYRAERKTLLEKGAKAMREREEQAGAASAAGGSNAGADSFARGIAELTEALKRGDIDQSTYATAVAALSDASRSADSRPQPANPPSEPASGAPAPAAQARSPERDAPPTISPVWQGAIYTIAGAALIGGLVYYASNQSVDRRDGASMTGNQDLGVAESPPAGQGNAQMPGEPPFITKQRQEAEAALAANPKDVKALNTLTQLALREPQKAWNYNEQAREIEPDNPDSRMLHGVITATMGMPEKAQTYYDGVLEDVPDHAATWAWKGLTYIEMKEWDQAAEALRKAKALGLSDHTLDNALRLAENGGVAPGGPPMGAAPSTPPPSSGTVSPGNTATIASGVVTLAEGRSTFKAQTLFVNIKDPNNPGPPLAAKKLPPGPYPLAFSITEADRIAMGGPMGNRPMPETVQLSLRLDTDGNAFTKTPEDPQVTLDVTKGTKGLELTLE
jgi:tetratricopeptide (TPR) repeat protein